MIFETRKEVWICMQLINKYSKFLKTLYTYNLYIPILMYLSSSGFIVFFHYVQDLNPCVDTFSFVLLE